MPNLGTRDFGGGGIFHQVIDVGTTYVASAETKSGRILKGDVDFDSVAQKCSYISPVPGGVGPMTRVALLKNTLLAAGMKD